MYETPGLFEQQVKVLVHREDPQTSEDAARAVVKSNLRETWHKKIIDVLESSTIDMTAKEIAAALRGPEWRYVCYDISRRLKELVKSGDIKVADIRLSTVGNNGKLCQAYRKKE